MPPETPNPVPPKTVPPHRLVWLFGATVAPVFAIPWIVAELQGRQFSNAAVLIMIVEGVAATLILTRLCQLWPDLLVNSLRGTNPQGAWKRPAAVAAGIALACLANSFLSAYSLIGLPGEPPSGSNSMFTLLLLIGMIWLVVAFAFVVAITAAAIKPAASMEEIHPQASLKDPA